MDATKQCLGQWAEWASKKDLLNTPIADRTDSPDIKSLSQSRASELLFPILTQRLDSCSKAMVILRRMTDNGGRKDGLEAWRQIALEIGKLGDQSLLNKQTWLLTPEQAQSYNTLGEFVRNYEHQNALLNIADREGLYGGR